MASITHFVTINNLGFEDGLNGWIEVNPVSTSDIAFVDSSSLETPESSGRVHQDVDVDSNIRIVCEVFRLTHCIVKTKQKVLNKNTVIVASQPNLTTIQNGQTIRLLNMIDATRIKYI